MKKTVLFVLLDQYADWEGSYLAAGLSKLAPEEFAVKPVSLAAEPIRSMGGFTALPDYAISSAPIAFEGLILIGGLSWRTESARQVGFLVDRAIGNGKVLGGICDASAFLGTLGVLNQGLHTSNDLNDLKQWAGDAYTGETNYISKQAVRDGNLVTANGSAALEFAREVLLALDAAPEDKILDWYRFHKLGFYESSRLEL